MSKQARRPVPATGGGSPHYWPVPPSIILALFALTMTVLTLFAVNVVSYAYVRIGIEQRWAFVILFASIIGSRVNIPVARVRGTVNFEPVLVRVFGMVYVVPAAVRTGSKVIAVNVGGALIPVALSVHLVVVNELGWGVVAGVVIVSAITHLSARIVRGVGVVVPTLVPPAAAALSAWLIDATPVAAVAYVAGTIGTLIGADLLNLHHLRNMEGPVLSIGGAGTFDGIFVAGVLAVLLAAA